MDQNAEVKNQKFFRKHQNTLMILGGIVILLIIFFATKKNPSDNETASDQNQEQTQDQTASSNSSSSNSSSSDSQSSSSQNTTQQDPGNVSVVGTLKASDNLAKGNLMLDSAKGKIYIQTKRDQSALMGKQVTLQGQGDIRSFTFLGFTEGQVAGADTDTTAVGGGDTVPATKADVNISGKLAKSDNAAKGNYIIKTATSTVYLQTQRDLSGWVDQDVNLAAAGTIQSFTNATVTKK